MSSTIYIVETDKGPVAYSRKPEVIVDPVKGGPFHPIPYVPEEDLLLAMQALERAVSLAERLAGELGLRL